MEPFSGSKESFFVSRGLPFPGNSSGAGTVHVILNVVGYFE
ncbi:MAG TPA: hypothetical protein VJ885_16870 [Thermoanaerobaculia bacterium]|nr:hypothetical protein [Thermoanaerobaculia bacterium]